MRYALQLYSIRDEIKTPADFAPALERVKKMGYDGVEPAGYHEMPVSALRGKLDALSLPAVCCHEGFKRLNEDPEGALRDAKALGMRFLALAGAPCGTAEEIAHLKDVLAACVRLAEPMGITVLYHNHDREFYPVDGVKPIDEIKKVCKLELDTFWSYVAGYDSADYIRENRERIALLHIKDGTKATRTPCAVGEGDNDIRSILRAAEEIGHEWAVVENDDPVPRGFDDAQRSIEWLHKNA